MPGRLFWAYFVGVAFVAAAIGAVVPKMTRPAGILLGILFFLFVVTLHIPRIAAHSRDGNEWTSGFVALAMCGGAWILANATSLADKRESAVPFLRLGRYFFALAIVAFGVQHFVNEKLTVRVGPPWFPGRPIWAYLTGTALQRGRPPALALPPASVQRGDVARGPERMHERLRAQLGLPKLSGSELALQRQKHGVSASIPL